MVIFTEKSSVFCSSLAIYGYDEQNKSNLREVNEAFWRSASFAIGAALELGIDARHDFVPLGYTDDIDCLPSI